MTARASWTPLTCVPGLGLDERSWAPTLRALARHVGPRPGAVVPLPGYGRRPAPGDDLRPIALGERLSALLQDLPGPTVLVGHSASCQVVAHTARLAPERVTTLVLVGPTTDPRASTWPRICMRWLRTAAHERPGQVPLLARTYTRTGLPSMLRAMDAARADDLLASLRAVRCPVLVVRGRHDRICPQDWAEETAAVALAGSAAVALARGAHMVPLTHADLLAAALRARRP